MPDSPSGDALFLDFDGTLVEIAGRPDDVVVRPELPAILDVLRRRLDGALAIATGRPLADIDRFLPGLRLDGCGLHGLERRVEGRMLPLDLPGIAPEIEALRRRFAGRPGMVVEDKRIGVAVHWRLAPAMEDEARAAVAALASRLGPAYRVQDGKAVSEIVPAGAGKGEGIRALMRLPPYAGRRALFIGDDRTDEDGFAAVNALGGTTIKVGPDHTAARYRVASPERVRALLLGWSERGITTSELAVA